ncbi:hypothetical protein GW17_00030773 [Ensete ventricosum]|nr:hypothetical protein GW17_00030773 [Ensete ventricosum]
MCIIHSPLFLLLSPAPFSSSSSKFPSITASSSPFPFPSGGTTTKAMAQAIRGQEDAFGQAQLIRDAAVESRSRESSSSQLLGHGTHDQLCDAVQENLLNSDAEFNTVGQLSALSLQEKGRSQGTSSSAR